MQRIARNLAAGSTVAAKTALRAVLLAARQAQPERAAHDAQLAQRLSALLAERVPACVGFYWPSAGEFDARAVLGAWLAAVPGRHAALPVVGAPHAPLEFHAWHTASSMAAGRFGIAVPADAYPLVPDLLLVPCVGFDAARYRLGYGGGYYDRTLAARVTRPVTVGVAYECGRVEALPREAHDIPLDVIVTEHTLY